MMNNRNKKLGRPTGPSKDREKRPWDPESLSYIEIMALKYIAANPDVARWKIANHIGISGSRLSIISCSELGINFLSNIKDTPSTNLSAFKLYNEK